MESRADQLESGCRLDEGFKFRSLMNRFARYLLGGRAGTEEGFHRWRLSSNSAVISMAADNVETTG
jgi:hypothetical protein